MSRTMLLVGLSLSMGTLAGCSTKLVVRSIDADPGPASHAANPDGVVINRLTSYSVRVTSKLPITSGETPQKTLIDPHRLLEVGYCRMPFANGKLTLEVTKNAQTMTKAGVSGTTPVTNIVKAAEKGVSTDTQVREALNPDSGP
jgi:hypothetical protein